MYLRLVEVFIRAKLIFFPAIIIKKLLNISGYVVENREPLKMCKVEATLDIYILKQIYDLLILISTYRGVLTYLHTC